VLAAGEPATYAVWRAPADPTAGGLPIDPGGRNAPDEAWDRPACLRTVRRGQAIYEHHDAPPPLAVRRTRVSEGSDT
jgi:hypothetical protein